MIQGENGIIMPLQKPGYKIRFQIKGPKIYVLLKPVKGTLHVCNFFSSNGRLV